MQQRQAQSNKRANDTDRNLHDHQDGGNGGNGKCQRRRDYGAAAREAEDVVLAEYVLGLVGVGGRVDGAIPAVALEALVADVGDLGVGALKGAAQDGTANASRPVRVDRAVAHGGDVVAVLDNVIALGVVVGVVESADVAVVCIGSIGQVDDERGHAGCVAGVAAEEGGAVVQAKVDKGLLVGDSREISAIGNGQESTRIGGHQSSAVGPVCSAIHASDSVCRRVDGENNIHISFRLDQGVKRNVLQILTTINQGELSVVVNTAGLVVDAIEGIGVVGNILVILTNIGQNAGQDLVDYASRAVDLQEDLVEKGTGSTHDETSIVKAANTLLALRHLAIGEVRAKVTEGSKGMSGGVESANFPRVDFVDGGITVNDELTFGTAICNENRHGSVSGCELIIVSNRRESVSWASIGSVDELVRKSPTPLKVEIQSAIS